MKIVVLDGHPMNPGDLSWDALRELGEFAYYDRTPREAVVERARGAEIVLTNKVVFDKAAIDQLPNLRYIGVTATGTNIIDLDAAKARGIVVTNVPAYGTAAVAQMAFALLLELTNHVGHYSHGVHQGKWSASPDFCYYDGRIADLASLAMGIIGFGAIGKEVAKIARAFGMRILVHTRTRRDRSGPDTEFCDLDNLLSHADVVSLHCPLTKETEKLINAQRLSLMKPSAYLLNLARGPLVDEPALADALNNGKLAGAGLDVLSVEPPKKDNPLLAARNCIITPHLGWASSNARRKLMEVTVENVRTFLRGQPINVVAR